MRDRELSRSRIRSQELDLSSDPRVLLALWKSVATYPKNSGIFALNKSDPGTRSQSSIGTVEKCCDLFQECWDLSHQEEEATLSLDSIPFQLSLADIYDKVEFDIENQ